MEGDSFLNGKAMLEISLHFLYDLGDTFIFLQILKHDFFIKLFCMSMTKFTCNDKNCRK